MVQNIVNEKYEVMNRNQKWFVGDGIIGLKKKRVEFFIRVQISSRFYELKSSMWEFFLKEELHVSVKNTKM